MPEQLTKHPEVTLQVLRSAGAKCGEGAPQGILTQCPAERFCKLPGGEVCIYGLSDARNMTQIAAADWQAVQQAVNGSSALRSEESALDSGTVLVGGAGVFVGAVLATLVLRVRNTR